MEIDGNGPNLGKRGSIESKKGKDRSKEASEQADGRIWA